MAAAFVAELAGFEVKKSLVAQVGEGVEAVVELDLEAVPDA